MACFLFGLWAWGSLNWFVIITSQPLKQMPKWALLRLLNFWGLKRSSEWTKSCLTCSLWDVCTAQSDKRQHFTNSPDTNTHMHKSRAPRHHETLLLFPQKLPYVPQMCLDAPRAHTIPPKSVISQLYRETYQLTSSLSLLRPSCPASRRCTNFSSVTCKQVGASTVLFAGIRSG